MPDDDDRPSDASSAADPAWSLAVAPDDISSLAADIAAYHRELRATRRRAYLRRLFARRGLSALTMAAVGLAFAATVATALSVLGPGHPDKRVSPLPLANPTVLAGHLHGLLPNVPLQAGEGKTVEAQALRPAVLALLPKRCDCSALLNSLGSDAFAAGLGFVVVTPTRPDADADALPGQLREPPELYYDSTGALRSGLEAPEAGLTLVLVDRDGTIFNLQTDVVTAAGTDLDGKIQAMLAPKVRASG